MTTTETGMSVNITKSALNFQANMAAAIINGTIDKGAEVEQNVNRSRGLAAEGIGNKLDAEA